MIAFTKILKKFDKVKWLYKDGDFINQPKVFLNKKKIIVLNDGFCILWTNRFLVSMHHQVILKS